MSRCLRILLWLTLVVSGLTVLVPFAGSSAGNDLVVVIDIKGTIDPGTSSYVDYALKEAERLDARAVILDFDTPGGYIDSAESIRGLLDQYNNPVYAYVNPNAISAGAYLALVAESIYMAPGSSMGAAELSFFGAGEADEKTISVWENRMISMAERRGRDPEIASAMVRSEKEIEGLVDRDKLLTLSATRAEEVGYCEAIVESKKILLSHIGLPDAELHLVQSRLSHTLVSWTTNPIVATFLLMIGIGGLILEVITAGFGVAGIFSMAAFALYFGGHIAAGVAEYWVVIMFVFGIALMLVEAFMPGFGIFGVSGLIATILSIVLAASEVIMGMYMLLASLVLAGVFSVFAFRYFSRRGALRHIILGEEEKSALGYVAPLDQRELTGRKGIAVTSLRPSGAAEIEGKRIDVVSEGSYIEDGTAIIVDRVEGARVIVRREKNND